MVKVIQRRIHTIACAACTFLLLAPSLLLCQQQKKPQVFKSAETGFALPFVLPSTLDLQLLEAFVLMQKANAGESPAQHELGLRYLLGRGFPAVADEKNIERALESIFVVNVLSVDASPEEVDIP